jgi:hypothetical protein
MRTALYVRLADPKHRLVSEYARANSFTINEVIERLVDQLLLQVAPGFDPPAWLIEAIRSGYLPFELPDQTDGDVVDHDDESAPGNVVKWRGAH